MKFIQILSYVSTAYSNVDHMLCREGGVGEFVYPRKMNWEKLIDFVDNSPPEVINSFTDKILGASPNTYIFTKHLSESAVEDAGAAGLPVLIFRPAIGMFLLSFGR